MSVFHFLIVFMTVRNAQSMNVEDFILIGNTKLPNILYIVHVSASILINAETLIFVFISRNLFHP